MLDIIRDELLSISKITGEKSISVEDRIEIAKNNFGKEIFSRKDYLLKFKDISSATASRDLKFAATNNILKKNGR